MPAPLLLHKTHPRFLCQVFSAIERNAARDQRDHHSMVVTLDQRVPSCMVAHECTFRELRFVRGHTSSAGARAQHPHRGGGGHVEAETVLPGIAYRGNGGAGDIYLALSNRCPGL